MKRMAGNAQIVSAVKTDKGGIGYVGIGYVAGKDRGVKILKVDGVSPADKEKVLAGNYYISRFLYQYVKKDDIKGRIKEFLQFELSEEGQKIVEKVGFYPVGVEGGKKLNPVVFQ